MNTYDNSKKPLYTQNGLGPSALSRRPKPKGLLLWELT